MGNKRTGYNIPLNRPNEFVDLIIKDYLTKKEFRQLEVKGEVFWQYGTGTLTAPKCIKYSYTNGILNLEVWFRIPILPNVYCGEMGLTGFYGWALKVAYKKEIEDLIKVLQQDIPNNTYGQEYNLNMDVNNNEQQINTVEPIAITGFDNEKDAKTGFTISIISLIASLLSVCIMLMTGYAFASFLIIIAGAVGISSSRKGKHSSKKGLATAGFIMGIIAEVISCGMLAIVFILKMLEIFM